MVRLASIHRQGKTKLVAHCGDDDTFVDLSSIASHARAFFELGSDAVEKAQQLISTGSGKIPASEATLGIPLDPSTCGKFLCIGTLIYCSGR